MISNEIIQDIQNRADIAEIIANYIPIIKKGNQTLAICPFHNDTNPSLSISTSKQIFKCWSCGTAGSVFSFVQKYEKISYIDAVKRVAKLINYQSDELNDFHSEKKVSEEDKKYYKVLEEANNLYSYIIKTEAADEANKYLESRKIDREMIEYFHLGYSPTDHAVIQLLRSKNYTVDDLDKAGVLVRKGQDFLDRFEGRITFPIYDEEDRVIGFSSRRIVDDGTGKYINSPTNEIFNKSKSLYNINNASKVCREAGYIYIVEGFMDVFALYKVGVKSSVALMGTAFTSLHAKILKNYQVELRLCLDGDDAGQHGQIAMIKILEKQRIPYRVVDYGKSKQDPDEILKGYGENVLRKLSNRLVSKIDYLISYFSKHNDLSTSEGRKNFASEIVEIARFMQDPYEKDILLDRTSNLTKINKETLLKEANERVNEISNYTFIENSPKRNNRKKITRSQRIQDDLMHQLLTDKDAIKVFNEGSNYFKNENYETLLNYLSDMDSKGEEINISTLITRIEMDEVENKDELIKVATNLADDENYQEYSFEHMKEDIENLRIEYDKEKEKKKINELKDQIDDPVALAKEIASRRNKK